MTTLASASNVKSHGADRRPLVWATWPMAIGLIIAVFALRLVYLIWLSPYELLGDEAYYWEWSRHLDLCYYEKGPGLAYLIAASTHLFGDAEWTVRLPAAVSSAIAAWAAGWLAMRVAGGDARAGFFTVLVFILLPAFQANAQICTQDAPLIALWLVATIAGFRIVGRWRNGESSLLDWLFLSAATGAGFLFKQSFLLFGPGLMAYWFLQRRALRWHRGLAWKMLAAVLLFVAIAAPMVVWNAQHGWPTLAHTEGHAGIGGDKAGDVSNGWDWRSLPILLGAQLGGFGPAALILMACAALREYRGRLANPEQWRDQLWLICCSVPAIGFFLLLSLATPVLGSWPFPSFGPLIPLVGGFVSRELVARKASSPGESSRGFRMAWRTVVIYGVAGWAIFSFPTLLGHIPGLNRFVHGPLARISGHRQAAAELAPIIDAVQSADGRPPMIVARYYMTAAEYAFYLPGRPKVFCAGVPLGKRPSSYDLWGETSLRDASLAGRSAVLDGEGQYPWNEVMAFDSMKAVQGGRAYVGGGFAGLAPRPHHQHHQRRTSAGLADGGRPAE